MAGKDWVVNPTTAWGFVKEGGKERLGGGKWKGFRHNRGRIGKVY